MSNLITDKELSKILIVGRVTLRKYREQGMPYKRLGEKLIRYDVEEVLEWLNDNIEKTEKKEIA